MITKVIALAHQEWTLNNNSRTKDNPPYCPCHTRSASYTVTRHSYTSSAFVMWFLLCAISLRCMILSVVAVGDTHYPPCPLFLSSPGYCIFVFFSMYSLLFHQKPFVFWSTYCSSLDRL